MVLVLVSCKASSTISDMHEFMVQLLAEGLLITMQERSPWNDGAITPTKQLGDEAKDRP